MSNLSFSSLNVNNLTINNLFSLIKSSVDYANPANNNLGPIANAALVKLTADYESFGLQINKDQKSTLTAELVPLDKDRDDTQANINRTVTFYEKGNDESKKSLAIKLKSFLKPYWNAASLPLNTQTGVIADMLVKYKANPELRSAVTVLGMDTSFTALETQNNAFDAVYTRRNNESSARITTGSDLKPTAVESYIQFCTAVEQAANFTPNDSILALFHNLETLRKKYHAMLGGSKDTPANDAPAK